MKPELGQNGSARTGLEEVLCVTSNWLSAKRMCHLVDIVDEQAPKKANSGGPANQLAQGAGRMEMAESSRSPHRPSPQVWHSGCQGCQDIDVVLRNNNLQGFWVQSSEFDLVTQARN